MQRGHSSWSALRIIPARPLAWRAALVASTVVAMLLAGLHGGGLVPADADTAVVDDSELLSDDDTAVVDDSELLSDDDTTDSTALLDEGDTDGTGTTADDTTTSDDTTTEDTTDSDTTGDTTTTPPPDDTTTTPPPDDTTTTPPPDDTVTTPPPDDTVTTPPPDDTVTTPPPDDTVTTPPSGPAGPSQPGNGPAGGDLDRPAPGRGGSVVLLPPTSPNLRPDDAPTSDPAPSPDPSATWDPRAPWRTEAPGTGSSGSGGSDGGSDVRVGGSGSTSTSSRTGSDTEPSGTEPSGPTTAERSPSRLSDLARRGLAGLLGGLSGSEDAEGSTPAEGGATAESDAERPRVHLGAIDTSQDSSPTGVGRGWTGFFAGASPAPRTPVATVVWFLTSILLGLLFVVRAVADRNGGLAQAADQGIPALLAPATRRRAPLARSTTTPPEPETPETAPTYGPRSLTGRQTPTFEMVTGDMTTSLDAPPTNGASKVRDPALAASVDRIASESAVDPDRLHATAATIERRTELTRGASRAAASDAATDVRLAVLFFCLLPVGVVALVLLVLGTEPTSMVEQHPLGWLPVTFAAVLMALGAQWLIHLPSSRSRLFAGLERSLGQRQRHVDRMLSRLATAELYIAAGRSPAHAIDAALTPEPMYATSATRRGAQPGGQTALLPAPADPSDPWAAELVERLRRTDDPSEAQRLLEDGSAQLHAELQAEEQQRVLLLRFRAVGPFVLCFVPAAAILLAAFALPL